MKALYFAGVIALIFSTVPVHAQKKAELDNNTHLTVVRTEKVTGRTHEIHYTITNSSAVSMDFSLYKQLTNGSWDVTHHLDLAPGATYEDVSGFTSVTGKYVVFSAPHSDWASFPSQFDVDKAIAANPAGATPPTTPVNSGAPSVTVTTPQPNKNPAAPSATNPPPPKDNSAPPIPPPI